mgnify:CR=1 FL=1
MKFTQLNELQMPTWRWLNMNATELDAEADFDTPYTGGVLSADESEVHIAHHVDLHAIENLPEDVARMREFVFKNQNYALTVTIPKGLQVAQPVLLEFVLDDTSPMLIDFLHIKAEAGSRADVIVRYLSSGDGAYFHSGFAHVQADAKSQVRLIKLQTLGKRDTHIDTTAVSVGVGARGDALFCELGGGRIASGCNISLAGTESRGALDALYFGTGERIQDFNYRMELRGTGAEGEIVAKGVLTGKAKKTLKSTLDFIAGALGAKGSEEETVLALSDRAVNLSAPLLLSGEANVEGSHATSGGKPDPGKLYYLMSRGFTEAEAKRLLVEASFTPILNKLPLQELRGTVYDRIQEVVHDES